jgi:hypothetical protein
MRDQNVLYRGVWAGVETADMKVKVERKVKQVGKRGSSEEGDGMSVSPPVIINVLEKGKGVAAAAGPLSAGPDYESMLKNL